MKFLFPFLLFLCLFPVVSFAQIEIRDGTRPMYVDDISKVGHGKIYDAVVHIGASPAGTKDKVFTLLCFRESESGNDNPDCASLPPGPGYTIRRIPNNDPRAYPIVDGVVGSVEVTYPPNMGIGFGGKKVVFLIKHIE
jgi:hypothetical protein